MAKMPPQYLEDRRRVQFYDYEKEYAKEQTKG